MHKDRSRSYCTVNTTASCSKFIAFVAEANVLAVVALVVVGILLLRTTHHHCPHNYYHYHSQESQEQSLLGSAVACPVCAFWTKFLVSRSSGVLGVPHYSYTIGTGFL